MSQPAHASNSETAVKLPPVLRHLPSVLSNRMSVPIVVAFGVLCGGAVFLTIESNALSYLKHGPEACLNCHVMNPHYATWRNSSHSRHAVCIDCHLPHGNIVSTYLYKAMVGTRDMVEYLGYAEHEAIRLRSTSPVVIEQNCRRCHQTAVLAMPVAYGPLFQPESRSIRCWDCHRDVPHTSVSSLSSTPDISLPGAAGSNTASWIAADLLFQTHPSR